MLRLYLCSVFVFVLTTKIAAADFIFTPTSGSSSHQFSSPYSGKFQAINGVSFDVSQYYASSRTELYLSGLAMWDMDGRLSFTVPWSFDLGYKSALFETDPVLQLGVSVNILSENQSFRFGVVNLFTIGGNISETPCVDRLFRDFHCGTGLPWVD
ncbi:hypothetical protein N8140_02885, partial [Octadecabacter sp.]|nr:hypothetical protein [Octadecabacter sp.]